MVYPIVFDTAGYMFSFSLQFDVDIFIYTCLIIFGFSIFLREKEIVYIILDSLVLIPTLVVNCFYGHSMKVLLIYILLKAFIEALKALTVKVRIPKLRGSFEEKNIWVRPVILVYAFVVLAQVIQSGGTLNPFENYINSYSIRADSSYPGFLGYLFNSFLFLLVPLIFYFFDKRSYQGVLIIAVIALMIYSLMPLTLYILMTFLMVAIEVGKKATKWSYSTLIQLTVTSVLLISILDVTLLDMMINRFYFTVGVNNLFYLDYFSSNDLYLFQNSKIGIFFDSNNYSEVPGLLIDRYYYKGLGSNQSSGVIGSAFANGGAIGVLLTLVILSVLITFIEVTHNLRDGLRIKVLLGLALVNFPLHQLFLTNGLIIYLILKMLSKDENSTHHRVL